MINEVINFININKLLNIYAIDPKVDKNSNFSH